MSVDNPYQSPQATAELVRPEIGTQAGDGLSWILFSFQGRVPRSIYWLTSITVGVVFYAVVFALAAMFGEGSPVLAVTILLMYVPLVWISLAVQIKRWHDRDKSGWWVLITFIPIIGAIWALIELGILRGSIGPNRFGADPFEPNRFGAGQVGEAAA